jgi:protein-tyrosine-phosphatase
LFGITVFALGGGRLAAAAKPRSLLFVCQAGTVKSAIARELAKRMARERGLRVAIRSRGIAPEDHLTPELIARLAAKGIDPRREPVRKLRQSDLDRAGTVILFDPLPAGLTAPAARDWRDTPSVLRDYDKAIAVIEDRIGALLDEMSRQPGVVVPR